MISPRALLRTARRPPLPHVPNVAWNPHVPADMRGWRRLAPMHLVWLAVWAPWWIGNDMPPPRAPRVREPEMSEPQIGGAGAWILDQLDDLRFRFGLTWGLALVLRGAWLGGLAGIGWIVVAQLSAVSMPSIVELMPLGIVGALLGLALRLFHRPGYHDIAHMLDVTFSLRSRVSTAVMGLRFDDSRPAGLHALQLADAANALSRARGLISREHWLPVREIFMACIVAVILLFLMVAQQPENDIATISKTGIPGFVPVSERLAEAQEQAVTPPEIPDAATVQEVEDISRESNQARQDLDQIGEALEGNAVTAPAGESIEAGDYPQANTQLSESSGDVAQLPEADRSRLADKLDEAAEQVEETNPELADSARNASDDVRSGEDTGALDELGEQIEQTGSSVVSQDGSSAELADSPSGSSPGTSQQSPGGGNQEAAQQPPQGGQGEGGQGAPQAGDPGAGMSASGGVGQSGEEGSSSEGSGSPSENGQEGGQPGDASQGNAGEPTSNGSGASGSGQGETAADANDGSLIGNPNEEGVSSQGSGAGAGQRNANDPNEASDSSGGSDLANENQAPEAGEGEAGDPPPGGGDDEGGDSATTDVPQTNASIMLPGTSDDRVRSGSDIGSSSVGSGGGVGAASGDSSGGTAGSAGPDSNDVPEAWRQIVEDYFREGGAP